MGGLHLLTIWFCALATLPTTFVNAARAKVLIYSATERFRHDSIPTAIRVLKEKSGLIDVDFDNTEDESWFTDEVLQRYDALLFLSTTGEVLKSDAPFQKYINAGGNFVGVHSASDTLRNSTAYINTLGSRFDVHADLQNFTVNVLEPEHPSTKMLPATWNLKDEPYKFEIDPRRLGAKVVLSADESSYVDNTPTRFDQGSPPPIAWYEEKAAGVQSGGIAGRSFYTSLGHLNETWQDDIFISHVLGGISWVLQSNTTRAYNSSATVGNSQASGSATSPSGGVSTRTSNATRIGSFVLDILREGIGTLQVLGLL